VSGNPGMQIFMVVLLLVLMYVSGVEFNAKRKGDHFEIQREILRRTCWIQKFAILDGSTYSCRPNVNVKRKISTKVDILI